MTYKAKLEDYYKPPQKEFKNGKFERSAGRCKLVYNYQIYKSITS